MWKVTTIKTEQVTEDQMNKELELLKQYGYKETKNPIVLLIGRVIKRWRA